MLLQCPCSPMARFCCSCHLHLASAVASFAALQHGTGMVACWDQGPSVGLKKVSETAAVLGTGDASHRMPSTHPLLRTIEIEHF